MSRNNFICYNPREYDDQLSPFGRKVLRTLIKQWNTERDRNIKNLQAQCQRRSTHAHNRVLTFGEHSSTPRVTQTHAFNFEDVNESSFEFLAVERRPGAGAALPAPPAPAADSRPRPRPRPVPTSAKLVAPPCPAADPSPSLVPYHDHKTHSITRDDLITSVDPINCTNRSNSLQYKDFFSQDSVEKGKDTRLPLDLINNREAGTATKSKDTERNGGVDVGIVNWDNMFDTHLFSEVNNTPYEPQTQQPHHQTTIETTCTGEESHPEDKHKTEAPGKDKLIVDSDKGTNKRKIQTRVTETIPKKVKRAVEKKPKKKTQIKNPYSSCGYAEAVTNWLNDVDPTHTVEDSGESTVSLANEKLTNWEKRKPEIVVEKVSKSKPTKKVVQAQLANKGGVMKFGKPKTGGTSTGEATAAAAGSATEGENQSKEKKSKPKFVAPIKSQTAVTEVDYEVLEFTDALVARYELDGSKKQEVAAVLLYSDGSCQLSEQPTEAAGAVAGLLLHIDEELNIYLDGSQKHLAASARRVLRANALVCYDAKAVLVFLAEALALDVAEVFVDVMDAKIAGALLDADSPPESFAQLQRALGAAGAEGAVGGACARSRAAGYAARLRAAADVLRARLRRDQLWDLFVDVEMQLVPVVADMERRGVRVDVAWLRAVGAALQAATARAAEACAAAAGRPLQLHSAPQLRALLYDELRLHTAAGLHVRATGATGAKSTDEATLRSLAAARVHPLPGLVLEHRRLHKAHATFVSGVLGHVRDGVVRPVWEQSAAATGRLASSAPNLQAVPKAPLLLPAGGEPLRLRTAYVCAAGCVLLAADFRHVECRVFARAAQDAAMQRALQAPDFFATLAADWLKKPETAVTAAERERTKRTVYASLYGAGPRKLADKLGVDYPAALSVAGSFARQFPSVRRFGRAVAARARAAGGRVTSLGGRVRRLPDVTSVDAMRRAHAERQAVNFVIQGSAADVCKSAMVRAARALRAAGLRARLLLSVHDELVWELAQPDLDPAAEVIRLAMETCGARAGIPRLPVALSAGRSWGQLQPYTPPPAPAQLAPEQ